MRISLRAVIAATGLMLGFTSVACAEAPKLGEKAASPVAHPYPAASLAPVQVREAFVTAAKTHRRILLDFGGNWCPDCLMLAGVFALPDVSLWLNQHFVIVPVNVGRLNANLDLARKYGVSLKAVPTVAILTADGRVLNRDGAEALGKARSLSPQAVVDLIDQWNSRP